MERVKRRTDENLGELLGEGAPPSRGKSSGEPDWLRRVSSEAMSLLDVYNVLERASTARVKVPERSWSKRSISTRRPCSGEAVRNRL